MSPFWARAETLHLGPGALAAAGKSHALAGDLSAALAGVPLGWLPRGTRCRVVLDDALLRYALIRWPVGVGGRREQAAYVAHRLREVHGIGTPEWQWQVDQEVPPHPAVVCAMPAALLASIRSLAATQRWRIESIQGAFCELFNRRRRQLAAPHGALVWWRPGRSTMGIWQNGMWLGLRSQAVDGDPSCALALMLAAAEVPTDGGVVYSARALTVPAGWTACLLGDAS
ncbi:MAG: hypothetical protein JNJ44_05330 [Zoogloeaceae bacterium]|nr:hypothetical protein [Zoogloeaceae bacterium]